jgi:eukaryotic-like serine/threonine-protein kinase
MVGPPLSDLLIGKRIGELELLMPLARGGMGSVYLARHSGEGGFERLVAVKCIPQRTAASADEASVLDEIRLSALLRHPNIVTTTAVREAAQHWLLISEYIEGESAATLIREARNAGGDIPLPIALRIAHDAARGLQAAHEQCDLDGNLLRIVHRDVSPENLLVGVDGTTRVLDFGIAKADGRAGETRDAAIKGKPPYLAPEVVRGDAVDARADVFSLGSVLFELATCERAFSGADDSATLMQILVCAVDDSALRARNQLLADILSRVFTVRPESRIESARALGAELQSCGELATHDTVAIWLSALCNARLRARRERLAEAMQLPMTGELSAVDPPAHIAPPNAAAPLADQSNTRIPKTRSAVFLLGAASTIGLLAIGARSFPSRNVDGNPGAVAIPYVATEQTTQRAISATSAESAQATTPTPAPAAAPMGTHDAGNTQFGQDAAGSARLPLPVRSNTSAATAIRVGAHSPSAAVTASDLHANPYPRGTL